MCLCLYRAIKHLKDRSRTRLHFRFFIPITYNCVYKDALYLDDFADCLRRLGANEGVSKEDSDRLNSFATGAEEAEMQLHKSFFTKWNISAEGVEQMPNSLLYTSYMKRIVATKCHAEGLAVLLPCFWVYMHVGKCMLKLREELGER